MKETFYLSQGGDTLNPLNGIEMKACLFKSAKTQAEKILDEFGFEFPPINPIKICEDLGVKVLFGNFPDKHKNISGFFNAKQNTIYINEEEFPQRQTFTISHELGHKILHEDWVKSNDYTVLFRDASINSKMEKNIIDQEANCFAANLLVPENMLKKYRRFYRRSELADIFLVPMPLITKILSSSIG